MKRIRAVMLAGSVALVLMAVAGLSPASASQYVAPGAGGGGVTTWTGTAGPTSHALTLGADKFTCSSPSFAGSMTGETATSLNVSPNLGTCAWNYLGQSVKWSTNSCEFRLRPGLGSGGKTTGWLDIVNCQSALTMSASGCLLSIGNQNGVGTMTFETTGAGSEKSVQVTANLSHLEYTRSGTCVGANGTFSDGTYTGSWNAAGTRNSKQVAVGVEALAASRFGVEAAPASIAGSNSGNSKRLTAAGALTCSSYSLSGSLASVTSQSITVAPSYSGCSWSGVAIPDSSVSAGGCSYVIYVSGRFDIAGANCASNPMTISRPGCTVTVGPQSNLTMGAANPYSNEGWGKTRTVSMASGFTNGLKYTAAGAACGGEGTFSNGSVVSTAKLSATDAGGSAQGLWFE